jgi:hypothetical protein
MQEHDQSDTVQARKILTQHIFAMIDKGEHDSQRLTVGELAQLKALERDRVIRSACESIESTASRESAAPVRRPVR